MDSAAADLDGWVTRHPHEIGWLMNGAIKNMNGDILEMFNPRMDIEEVYKLRIEHHLQWWMIKQFVAYPLTASQCATFLKQKDWGKVFQFYKDVVAYLERDEKLKNVV